MPQRSALPPPLPRAFFARPPEQVAPDLLGQWLCRNIGKGAIAAGRIVEVEAYQGRDDPAAHAFRGPSLRNATLFGPPGHAYVYTSYGVHQCLNVSTQPAGQAGCVLIRALEPLPMTPAAERWLQTNAPTADGRKLLSGPGRLCRALAISRAWDGLDLTMPGRLWVAAGPAPRAIHVGPRVGITRAAERPLRFFDPGSAAVSAHHHWQTRLVGQRGHWRPAGPGG